MKIIRPLLLMMLLFDICNKGFAQNHGGYENEDYWQFAKAFNRTFEYPIELQRVRKPIICLIKVEVDSAKNILDMQLSDSADSVMRVQFDKHKRELNTKPLLNYLKSIYKGNNCTTYIIPLSFAMFRKQVSNQVVKLETYYNYSRFSGKFLTGKIIFLEPLSTEVGIAVP
jgi:hypothetical protein